MAAHITYLSPHVLMPAGHNHAHTWKQLLWQSAPNQVSIPGSGTHATHGGSGSWMFSLLTSHDCICRIQTSMFRDRCTDWGKPSLRTEMVSHCPSTHFSQYTCSQTQWHRTCSAMMVSRQAPFVESIRDNERVTCGFLTCGTCHTIDQARAVMLGLVSLTPALAAIQ